MVLNQTTEQKQTIQNEEIISTYVQIALGTYPEVERSGGMILTEEDVINIKLYVKYGFALPEKLEEVKSYLGYDAIGIAGLEPKDIQELFRGIKFNVSKWNGIEAAILTQSRELETFSSNIILTGDEIIQYIDEMPAIQKMKEIQQSGVIPPGMLFDFDPDDHEIATELVSWLAELKSEVETRKTDALNLKNKITDFKEEIGNTLQPSLSRKIQLIKDNKLDEQIQDLTSQIEEKRKEIKQLEEDYDKYTGLAFSGLLGGLIGVSITGGIFGSKAEDVRKRKNQAVVEKKALTEQLSASNKLKKAVEKVGDNFANINISLLDAEQAAANLQVVWDNIYYQIDISAKELANITDAKRLSAFKLKFQKVINPWREVEDLTNQLAQLFNKALEEYKKLETSISKPLI